MILACSPGVLALCFAMIVRVCMAALATCFVVFLFLSGVILVVMVHVGRSLFLFSGVCIVVIYIAVIGRRFSCIPGACNQLAISWLMALMIIVVMIMSGQFDH